ncbi:MAG: hypothetical protein L3J97_03220 [Thermoplasmata archaeon]|nr:hypothetical protein [Thermoplasmata archaeon]
MRARLLRYEYLVMGALLALVAVYYLAVYNDLGIAIGVGLIVVAAILLGLTLRRPPGPAVTTVPAP